MWWFVSVIPPLESQRQTDHWPASQASLLSLSQKGAWTVMKNGNGTLSCLLASTHSDLHTHVHLHMWTHAHTHAHTPTLGHTLLHHDLCNLSVLTIIHSLPVHRGSLISCHPHPHREMRPPDATAAEAGVWYCGEVASPCCVSPLRCFHIWRSWRAGMAQWLRNSDATSPEHEESSCKCQGHRLGSCD